MDFVISRVVEDEHSKLDRQIVISNDSTEYSKIVLSHTENPQVRNNPPKTTSPRCLVLSLHHIISNYAFSSNPDYQTRK